MFSDFRISHVRLLPSLLPGQTRCCHGRLTNNNFDLLGMTYLARGGRIIIKIHTISARHLPGHIDWTVQHTITILNFFVLILKCCTQCTMYSSENQAHGLVDQLPASHADDPGSTLSGNNNFFCFFFNKTTWMRVFSQINNCQQKQNKKTKQKTKAKNRQNKKAGSAFRLG